MNLKIKRQNNSAKQKGSVMIEAAILIPLILLISITGLEVSRSLKSVQVAAQLSREAASIAYRECGGDRGDILKFCLRDVQQSILSIAQTFNIELEVMVTLVVSDGSTAWDSKSPKLGNYDSRANRTGKTVFITEKAGDPPKTITLDDNPRTMAIGEVWVKFEQVLPFSFGNFSDWYDEISVI